MEHAWLDSLSEDWPSQPGSDTSAAQLPPLKNTDADVKPKETPSRIPRRTAGSRPHLTTTNDNSKVNILSERSTNDINIPYQTLSSRLSKDTKNSLGSWASRSVSVSTNGSVVHNTVQHKSTPGGTQETPEWKRRLIYNDMQYGEQRDLFCSAANGLQDMFKPPTPTQGDDDDQEYQKSSMPSSPPSDSRRPSNPDFDDLDALEELDDELDDLDQPGLYPNDVTPSPSPRRAKKEINYRLNVEDDSTLSSQPNSTADETPSRQRDSIFRDESCLSAATDANESRKPSGQSVVHNEDFSPILIGKQSNKDGKMDFAPIELPADQLKQKLETLRINQMLLDSENDPCTAFDGPSQEGLGNLDNTDDYARTGGFLNLQRGGRSGEGSFRYRDLSPGFGVDTSEMLPEESLQASTPKQFPSTRITTNPFQNQALRSPSIPRAPFPSPEKKMIPQRGGPSGGSPLKLFGPYDTFTNQTLLRRISQFEEGMSGTPSQQSLSSPAQNDRSMSPAQQPPAAASSPIQSRTTKPVVGLRSVSYFGTGQFDGYEFSRDVSYASQDEASFSDKENVSPRFPVSSPGYQQSLRGLSPGDEPELFVRRHRNKSSLASLNHSRSFSGSSQIWRNMHMARGGPDVDAPKRDSGSEGKRPRTSPSKDPTPKRRRTLHRSDIAFGHEDRLAGVDSAHHEMQSVMGKKRKDARPGTFQLANPNVLAMRAMLRPRSPTPSQRSSQLRDQHPYADSDNEISNEAFKKSPIRALQEEELVLSSPAPSETDRKPSIRTQDFVDQAAQIMAMIRNQVRPPGLSSVEESEAEHGITTPEDPDDSYQSTKEPLSRPPSREGRPMSRLPQRQEDPELIDRLKKYQELSDMGDIISSSMRSMGLARDAIRAAQEIERQIDENSNSRSEASHSDDEGVISDPPNIRLSFNPAYDELPTSPSRDSLSHSSGVSTSRSYHTGTSRDSDIRKTIMPESVSHLIPDRVGSMYLDKQNNIWIKKKETPTRQSISILPSDSEDDPFASIPDLSVDLTREMQNLVLVSTKKANAPNSPSEGTSLFSSPSSSRQPSRNYVTLSPDGQLSPNMASLAREEFEKLDVWAQDHEADMDNGMGTDRASSTPSTTKRRNLTITFSSPVASIIQDVVAEDLDSLEDDPATPNTNLNSNPTPKKSPGHSSVGRSALKNGSIRSMGSRRTPSGAAFVPRPVSRIDEQDEDSTIEMPNDEQRQVSIIGETSIMSHKTPDGRRASLSFIVERTPRNNMLSIPVDDSAVIGHNVGKLSLSPLSEFTLNNSNQSFGFEVSYVVGQHHLATGDGSKRVLSMTIRDLVDKLSEVEPYEPYWEDITELDLHEKRLGSLHMLDQFCGKLVTLDASQNALGHLEGVPPSVRELKVSSNLLTELTSWDHLMNLQYVDISGNEIQSLSALKGLVHLRSIKADNNQLTSLDGLDAHDGLLSLRARDNLITEVDFGRTRMGRLTTLDLCGNQITAVRNLELAPALAQLKLSNNHLESFTTRSPVRGLRQLDLSDNRLSSLDIANLPSLHSLYADRNKLVSLTGFSSARRLDSLSLREQQGDEHLDLGFLSAAYEVRKLFLSGNYIGTFDPTVDYLNLQLLELANCGIQALPEHLGQLMPNLRTLNVNFNAIRDLEPLRFIPRLKKLLAAGNRLADSTTVTELLLQFPHLSQLDLRDNPVTTGFYPSMQVLVAKDGGFVDPFTLPEADKNRDELFASRLDETTKLRRRLHQIVLVTCCKKLRMLDGLALKRQVVLAKDVVFQALVAEGLLPDETLVGDDEVSEQKQVVLEPEVKCQTDTLRSSAWNAEDSFA